MNLIGMQFRIYLVVRFQKKDIQLGILICGKLLTTQMKNNIIQIYLLL